MQGAGLRFFKIRGILELFFILFKGDLYANKKPLSNHCPGLHSIFHGDMPRKSSNFP